MTTTPAAPDMFSVDIELHTAIPAQASPEQASPEQAATQQAASQDTPAPIERTAPMRYSDPTPKTPTFLPAGTYHAIIKVIGVGGGGGNAIAHMMKNGVDGVEFIAANTDAQALKNCGTERQLQLGGEVTKGLGAGTNPEVGRQAALEDKELIKDALEGADMVFIAAGMGGGTGTGAAPVVAQLAKELGILTVAVVTKPFSFEGAKKMRVALEGIEELALHCDSLITIPNEKLISILGRSATKPQAFEAANDVLLDAVRGIADIIVRPSDENIDFADVRTVMNEMGLAMIGTGRASGDDRAQSAVEQAIHNPLLDEVNLAGANGVLVNITAGDDITMAEYAEVGRVVEQFASEDATIKYGTVMDASLGDEMRVTVVVTGINRATPRQSVRSPMHDEDAYYTSTRPSSRPHQHGNASRAPHIQLVRPQGLRDGTTGMLIEDPVVQYAASQGITPPPHLHARAEPTPEPSAANLGSENYLDIPAFLRRQCD